MNELTKPSVLLVVFNRPDHTAKVIQAIKDAKISRLYISADGPRKDNAQDLLKCRQVREAIENTKFNCEVITNFRDVNMGCKYAVSSGITWFFEQEEQGLILEDDCVPSQSFFAFCQLMLEKYKHDERVMGITGFNTRGISYYGSGDYYFSKILGCWGWASWRRAWEKLDLEMSSLDKFIKEDQIKNLFQTKLEQRFWMYKLKHTQEGGTSWAFPWAYSLFCNNGLCIVPNKNLVSNIGFGDESVHAKSNDSTFSNQPAFEINDVKHPDFLIPCAEADYYLTRKAFKEQMPNAAMRLKWFLYRMVKNIIGESSIKNFKKRLYK